MAVSGRELRQCGAEKFCRREPDWTQTAQLAMLGRQTGIIIVALETLTSWLG